MKKVYKKLEGLIHGGDYNPEQWLDRPDILEEDIRLMKEAGMNCATLGVFSWTTYEPKEGEYHFEWLRKIMDDLYANGIYTILATPTGARPAWVDHTYPEAMRVDEHGVRYHHGVRHNHCMSAPVFRLKARTIIEELLNAVGDHPGLIMFHINNEFGGECFCPYCVKRFQKYLSVKFDDDIDKLNKAWWTTFWSHTYNVFEQVEPPYANGEFSVMGLNQEWKKFTTWSMTDYMKFEIEILRKKRPDIPVTTNFMELYPGLDYYEMAKELDVVCWDSYPAFHNDYEDFYTTMARNSFNHAVIRSMKKHQPFMLMESAPGLVNWHPYNKVKRPGVHKLASLQAIACGSDTVQYFQWRKSRGSYEQYHGAVVDHLGTSDTRIFKEVADVGANLKLLKEIQGSYVQAKVAIIYDWENRWAIEGMKGLAQETKNYPETCELIYRQLLHLGVDADVVSQQSDLSDYQLVIAPMMYLLKEGTAESFRSFVENGGTVLATYLTGYVDENQLCYLGGFPGDGLKDLFGVISEEIDTLYPSDRNAICFENHTKGIVRDYAEVLRVQDAKVLATYESDFYKDMPAYTVKEVGKGRAYYLAARLEEQPMRELLAQVIVAAGLEIMELPEQVETHLRVGKDATYRFFQNHGTEEVKIKEISGVELLSGKKVENELIIERNGTKVIKSNCN